MEPFQSALTSPLVTEIQPALPEYFPSNEHLSPSRLRRDMYNVKHVICKSTKVRSVALSTASFVLLFHAFNIHVAKRNRYKTYQSHLMVFLT
uniref:Uncharacterized protein n=1 Tax=Physcomitrium patens TaxID=3218 RepID=A0A2K1JIY4_PHYPA|nr:hypothetical protein PHYPA_018920 [Physcomitrium patens]